MDRSQTGASSIVTLPHFYNAPALIVQKEDKLAKGEGHGASYMQNIALYAKYWARDVVGKIFSACECPTILIEQAGHDVSK